VKADKESVPKDLTPEQATAWLEERRQQRVEKTLARIQEAEAKQAAKKKQSRAAQEQYIKRREEKAAVRVLVSLFIARHCH